MRNAVEAALKARSWAANAHLRAQVLYYLAENFTAREAEAVALLTTASGQSQDEARAEVAQTIERTFLFAGLADKLDGKVHATKPRHLCLSLNEPLGVVGVIGPDDAPLLGLVSMVLPLIAAGNAVIAILAGGRAAGGAALSTAGYVRRSGRRHQPADRKPRPAGRALADHDAVDAVWVCRTPALQARVETLSAGNLKQTWE